MLTRLGMALLLLMNLVAGQAVAGPSGSAGDEPLPRPIGAVRVSTFSGIPDFLSASASLTLARPFELEAGVNWYEFSFLGGTGRGYYVRGGYMHERKNYRNSTTGKGFTENLGAMIGYRYNHSADVFGVPYINHAASLTFGMEVAQWQSRHFGLSGQLAAGFNYWFKAEEPVFVKFKITPDVRISMGVCF